MAFGTIEITLLDEESEEETIHVLPAKNEVCSRCDGFGVHTNPSIDGNGITGSEMAEILYEDPDFLDDYMGGTYDIICEECHGNKVVLVPDEQACSAEQLKVLQQWNDQENERAENAAYDRAERNAERRMMGDY